MIVRRLLPLLLILLAAAPQDRKPNIVFIITDDQGYGDVGFHGNDKIRTPNLDQLASQSVELTHFYVQPVCSPTRACLLTGRYNYRTGIVDTYQGRSMMHPDEVTLAEILGDAGYRTGIFGKWHLGDNYPLRAQDQGFQESLTIRGGGIGQASDIPGGDHYQDPTVWQNGKPMKSKGYCTDVFTDAALEFITANRDKPFFAYVPFNAPHTPLEVPEGYLKPYQDMGLPEITAKIYAMVSNIDHNVGRLLAKLDELSLARDTIVIFMTDNGPQQERYNAGLRGLKTTVFEGGVRVPFLMRLPRALRPRKLNAPMAHVDILPTLLDACSLRPPKGLKLDGFNRWAEILGGLGVEPGPTLVYFQWHRGDVPEKFRSCAVRSMAWKAIWTTPEKPPMLFNVEADPFEKADVAAEHPEEVERLTSLYDRWFDDVRDTRQFAPPRIILGTPHEDPAVLTRQNWRGPKAGAGKDADGHWLVEIPKETKFDVTLRFRAPGAKTSVQYSCGATSRVADVAPDATSVVIPGVVHPTGPAQLGATIAGAKPYGVEYVELKRVE